MCGPIMRKLITDLTLLITAKYDANEIYQAVNKTCFVRLLKRSSLVMVSDQYITCHCSKAVYTPDSSTGKGLCHSQLLKKLVFFLFTVKSNVLVN